MSLVVRGNFVVAVSGGVDSVALLDILCNKNDFSEVRPLNRGVRLTVAHFDHGIREDSREDRVFVQGLARKYGLPFVYDEGRLGAEASEAAAREARYAFLRRAKLAAGASAIVTAHHEDDMLETAIINLLRGTGRKGLSSLQSTGEIYRPLLSTPKTNIIKYAQLNNLQWREDSTNADLNYLRNYVRGQLLTRFDAEARRRLRALIDSTKFTNDELDNLLAQQFALQPAPDEINRRWFISLPHAVAREVIVMWLRGAGVMTFDKKTIERIVTHAKTLGIGKRIDVNARHIIIVKPDTLALMARDR